MSSMPQSYHFVSSNTLIFHHSLCLLLDCMVYCDLLLHFLHSLFCDFFDLSLTPNLSISIPLNLISFMDSLSHPSTKTIQSPHPQSCHPCQLFYSKMALFTSSYLMPLRPIIPCPYICTENAHIHTLVSSSYMFFTNSRFIHEIWPSNAVFHRSFLQGPFLYPCPFNL